MVRCLFTTACLTPTQVGVGMQWLLQHTRFSILLALISGLASVPTTKWSDIQAGRSSHWGHLGVWSSWTMWSECSRTCGGGVSVQTRECLTHPSLHFKKHLRYKQHVNQTQIRCVGIYIRHQLCNAKPCPGKSSSDFRKEQCSAFDHSNQYKWEPFYEATAPCALNCRAVGFRFYATLAQQVVDGTPCDYRGSMDKICVSGVCKLIGCDGLIGSDKVFDHCGICGGDNSTCRIVSGLFTRPQLPPGYNLITSIPQGACNINITQLKNTKNYLALRQSGGEYIINGDWALNWPGDYPAVGTTFTYQRDDGSGNVAEFITAKGPITGPLDIMMIYKQLNPGIKYQYTLPLRDATRSSSGDVIARPMNDVIARGGPHANVMTPLSDTPTQYSTHDIATKPPRRPGKIDGTRTKARRHYIWQINGFSECSKTCAGGTQTTVLACVKQSSGAVVGDLYCKNIPKIQIRTVPCNTKPCPPEWVPGEWSQCSTTCGPGMQQRDFTCKQQISPNVQAAVSEGLCSAPVTEPRRQTCHIVSCTLWRVGRWSQCSTTCGKGMRSRQAQCIGQNEVTLNEYECTEDDKPATEEICDLGSCSKTWFFTEWSTHQCSSGCNTGIQSRKVFCPHSEEGTCEAKSKPQETRNCPASDSGKCPGRWFTGPWNHCSVSCGKGVQSRDIICMMFIRNQYRPVLDFQCSGSDRPLNQQPCQMQECGSEWYFTQWAECSMSCDRGTQTREVRCLSEGQKPSLNCPNELRPNSYQECNTHECHNNRSQKDSGCLDKYKNCHLVAQSRLCTYNYYREACCQSCARFS